MSLAARSAMKQFPLTTLIQLYELLKNSRLTCSRCHSQQPSSLVLRTSRLGVDCRGHKPRILRNAGWWRMTGSNRRPPACKAGALPAELIPQDLSIEEDGGSGWS